MVLETPRISVHTCPHKSYLPVFDIIVLECTSVLCMCRNKFCIAQKSPMQESEKTVSNKMSNILYLGLTCNT